MCDSNRIVWERQWLIRQELEDRNITLKFISFCSKVGIASLVGYFPADRNRTPTNIPAPVLYSLAKCNKFPLDLLSLLLPDGVAVVRSPEVIDHNDVATLCGEIVTSYAAARSPRSEAGIEIGEKESAALDSLIAQLRGMIA